MQNAAGFVPDRGGPAEANEGGSANTLRRRNFPRRFNGISFRRPARAALQDANPINGGVNRVADGRSMWPGRVATGATPISTRLNVAGSSTADAGRKVGARGLPHRLHSARPIGHRADLLPQPERRERLLNEPARLSANA